MTSNDSGKNRSAANPPSQNRDAMTVEEPVRGYSTREDTGCNEAKYSGFVTHIDLEALFESMSFKSDSVEEYISSELTGRIREPEANLVAIELGYLINSTAYKNGATIEERARNREVGYRIAELVALTFFNSTDEVEAFMTGIEEFSNQDAMLEKGYYFWEGQAYESYKLLSISAASKLDDTHWDKDTIETFKTHEQKVTGIIDNTKTTMCDDIVEDKLQQVLDRFSSVRYAIKEGGVFDDIQWIFDIQDRLLT